jgi:hypothetical protein
VHMWCPAVTVSPIDYKAQRGRNGVRAIYVNQVTMALSSVMPPRILLFDQRIINRTAEGGTSTHFDTSALR